MGVAVIPTVIDALCTVTKVLVEGLEELQKKKTSEDHLSYDIIMIGYNIEKSPGDLKRRAVTPTPVEDHQLKLVRKTLK